MASRHTTHTQTALVCLALIANQLNKIKVKLDRLFPIYRKAEFCGVPVAGEDHSI